MEAEYPCGCVVTLGETCRVGAGELLHGGGFLAEVERRTGETEKEMLEWLDAWEKEHGALYSNVWLRRILGEAKP